MSAQKWTAALFSPTGGTAKVARAILEGAGQAGREIDLSLPVPAETIPPEETLLAAAPVFGGHVPGAALERLAALKGQGGPAVAVVVYGNRAYEDALAEWKAALERAGFRVAAAGAFVAEHSIARSIAAGRPDGADLEQAGAFGRAAAEKLSRPAAEQAPVQVPGDPSLDKELKPMAIHPAAGEACGKCGTCAKKCPVGAIPREDPSQTDAGRCITCMRCVAVCPKGARALPAPAAAKIVGMLQVKAAQRREPELFL